MTIGLAKSGFLLVVNMSILVVRPIGMDITTNTFVSKQLIKLVKKMCNNVLVLVIVMMPRQAFV